MKLLASALASAVLVLVACKVDRVHAGVTITDWRGVSVVATAGQVDSGGVKIVYHTVGDNGPLVIFAHSIFGPWFDFRHQIVSLSERYRVVSMSTRGTDLSDKPAGVEHYASARIADDINALIDNFGEEKAVIVGQDAGGLHAWHFAMTYPERTAALVSLGSIHPAALIRELIDNPEQQQATQFQRNMQENPDTAARLEQHLRNFPPLPDEPEDLVRLRAEAYARLDIASIVGFYKANWPWSPVTYETEGFGFRHGAFPPVKSPTLFIYGKDSAPFTNQTLNDMWEWVDDDLAIHVLAGAGHDLHREAPEVVTPIILEWLDRSL